MADALVVLNAGSSSIKFSVFALQGAEPQLVFKGQVEGLYTAARFSAENASGESIGERKWDEGTKLGHEGGVGHIVEFLRAHRDGHRLAAVGHRVVHGGVDYAEPVRVDAEVLAKLDKL